MKLNSGVMKGKRELNNIYKWATTALDGLSRQWASCDEETGKECSGIRCGYAEHRAMVLLERICDEIVIIGLQAKGSK